MGDITYVSNDTRTNINVTHVVHICSKLRPFGITACRRAWQLRPLQMFGNSCEDSQRSRSHRQLNVINTFLLILLSKTTVPPLQESFPAQPESLCFCLHPAVKKSPSIPSIPSHPSPPSVPSLSSEAHLMQLLQENLCKVKRGEADPNSNGAFHPVHAEAFVKSTDEALL